VADGDVKDDWDASSEDEANAQAAVDIQESWDASSEVTDSVPTATIHTAKPVEPATELSNTGRLTSVQFSVTLTRLSKPMATPEYPNRSYRQTRHNLSKPPQ
jgi:hypothetical protein